VGVQSTLQQQTKNNKPDWNLEPVGGLRFEVKGLPGYAVEFKLDEKNKEASAITLIQPHGTFSGKRN